MKINSFDIGVIGGGLAGLALSIEQARAGRKVILFEKKNYPYHKVCGEYISNESRSYVEKLGVPLNKLSIAEISKLNVTTDSVQFNHSLTLGGFGISRYLLDFELSKIAKEEGVTLLENSAVLNYTQEHDHFVIQAKQETYHSTFLIGAYGKRSTIDKQMDRSFIKKPLSPQMNFIAVKYHIEAEWPNDLIGLHLFPNGYCGISNIEKNRFCLCYLTLQSNLDKVGSIEKMEEHILSKNPHLKPYLQSKKHYLKPLVISQVNFSKKNAVEKGMIMIGDTAGLIVPLCGNGMSMALHSAHQLSQLLDLFYRSKIDRPELERRYKVWRKKEFGIRLLVGRVLQRIIFNPFLAKTTIQIFKQIPFIARKTIALTHGKSFL